MKSEHATRLQALATELGSFIDDHNAEAAIVPGNGPNESMLIGSSDSFLRLAKALIETVRLASDRSSWSGCDLEEETIEGVPVIGTNMLKESFSEFSPIWPICAYIASDDNQAKKLTTKLSALLTSSASD